MASENPGALRTPGAFLETLWPSSNPPWGFLERAPPGFLEAMTPIALGPKLINQPSKQLPERRPLLAGRDALEVGLSL